MLPNTVFNNFTTNLKWLTINKWSLLSLFLPNDYDWNHLTKNKSISKTPRKHAVKYHLKASRNSLVSKWDLANGKFRMNVASSCMDRQHRWNKQSGSVYDPASDSIPSASSRKPIGVRWIPTYSTLEAILFLMLRSLRLAWTKITAREMKQHSHQRLMVHWAIFKLNIEAM